jgi:hypothetical protein
MGRGGRSRASPSITARILGDTARRSPRSVRDLRASAANPDFRYCATQRCNVRKETPDPVATERNSRPPSRCGASSRKRDKASSRASGDSAANSCTPKLTTNIYKRSTTNNVKNNTSSSAQGQVPGKLNSWNWTRLGYTSRSTLPSSPRGRCCSESCRRRSRLPGCGSTQRKMYDDQAGPAMLFSGRPVRSALPVHRPANGWRSAQPVALIGRWR